MLHYQHLTAGVSFADTKCIATWHHALYNNRTPLSNSSIPLAKTVTTSVCSQSSPRTPLKQQSINFCFLFLDEEYWQIWTLLALSRRYDISLWKSAPRQPEVMTLSGEVTAQEPAVTAECVTWQMPWSDSYLGHNTPNIQYWSAV